MHRWDHSTREQWNNNVTDPLKMAEVLRDTFELVYDRGVEIHFTRGEQEPGGASDYDRIAEPLLFATRVDEREARTIVYQCASPARPLGSRGPAALRQALT